MPDGVLYFEQTYYPFQEQDDLDLIEEGLSESMWTAIASPPGPLAAGPEGAELLADGARRLRQRTDRAIVGLFGGNLLEMGQFFYRNDNFLMLLAGNPKRAHEFLDRITAMHMGNLDRFLGAVGPFIDVIVFGDDLGMQSGPPSLARHVSGVLPAARTADVEAGQRTGARQGSCSIAAGGVRELLPGLIDAGLEAINPVQITCKGMDAGRLKADFGDRLTFWGGGCDTREILSHGTPAQVRQHVRQQVEIMRPGGGFVFQQVHNIMADVPPENIVAMYDAANG